MTYQDKPAEILNSNVVEWKFGGLDAALAAINALNAETIRPKVSLSRTTPCWRPVVLIFASALE